MKKQIPNILSAIRLAMIPIFIYVFFLGTDKRLLALLVFALASSTDILDGYLARRYNWVTPLGKLLDPIADKLMQAAVILCLTIENSNNILFIWIAILFIIKETAMAVGSLIVIRKKHDIAVSNWYGKAATVAFFCITAVLINSQNTTLNLFLGVLLALVLVTALLLYYFRVFRGVYGIKWRK
ncbi:MAG: CDP-diacylglycerol--glycerol-3-phosphate 3-phosphatidyltransferase [Firmicutes bacterium HGW-Firmicutes-21]|nr:MAG: CDP-diacylglycerol--glycerol-3-phosphate 3-phosphatidyltransferase [Firmicutes bacterium HGW-Firmicutes-21]